jgi:hypothetical protein
MLMVDMGNTNARLTLAEVLSSGRRYVSNPVAFASFAAGFAPRADLIMDGCWQLPGNVSGNFAFFKRFLHEVLPFHYNVHHLESLGGRFALRLTAVGDFTLTAMLRRVVTLRGLPLDEESGQPIIDAEMRADAFMALCNELLADLCEKTLLMLSSANAARQAGRA